MKTNLQLLKSSFCKAFGLIVFLCITNSSVFAQYVCGNITTDTTWTDTVKVSCDVTVNNGVTLTINPGTYIEFQGAYKLSVQGRLLAIGTVSDTITFTPADTTVGWRGIHFDSTSVTNDTSKIIYCKIQYSKYASGATGSALHFVNFSKAIVSHCYIFNNGGGSGSGNGIFMYGSSPVITYNTIKSWQHCNTGGGIYCTNNSSPFISNNTISYNSANMGGGIACVNSGSPIITHNTISYNTSTVSLYGGGGIFINNCSGTISNNVIFNNTSTGAGAGIYCNGTGFTTILNNTIYNNSATNYGGGIRCYLGLSAGTFISGNSITNNNSGKSGGGISFTIPYSNQEGIVISNNTITNNNASNYGGGIDGNANHIFIRNNTISNNNATIGGGIYSTSPTIYNTIFWGNTASTGGAQVYSAGSANFYNCNVQGDTAAFGETTYTGIYQNNIDTNPLFVAPSGGSGTGFDGLNADWSLQSTSPCFDAGTPDTTGLYLPTTDMAGNTRISGCGIDIGAFEYQTGSTPAYLVTASPTPNPICAGNTLTLTGATGPTAWAWTGPNGFTSSLQNPVITNITTADAGVYTLTANNACGIVNTVNTASVTVFDIPATPTAAMHTPSKNKIIWNWNTVSGATAYQWNTTNTYPGVGVNVVTNPTYTQTGLTCNTNYTLYIWACNACYNSSSATTLTQTYDIPVAPTAATHTPSENQIVWKWNTVSGATGYQWNTTNTYPGIGVNVVTNPTYTQAGLTYNTNYTLYIWAFNTCGNSTAFTTLTQTTSAPNCSDNSWKATATMGAPDGRVWHTAVWTGTEMIVWGGCNNNGNTIFNTGGRYNPTTNTWTAISTTNAPAARYQHTAVWTGTEMIVWGGGAGIKSSIYLNTGGRYNPATDTWTAITLTNAPTIREGQTAVWTGTEMIVWGGVGTYYLNTGGKYNPATDTWTAITTTNAPAGRYVHTAVWTGTEMIVWGGQSSSYYNTGGKYNPVTDTWTATTLTNAPVARRQQVAVWTGTEMIVWGGGTGISSYVNSGGRYNPATDSWTATSLTNAPTARYLHTAVWTGAEMIIWGGYNPGDVNTGSRYNPVTGTWIATTTTVAPSARSWQKAVWTGAKMIVWGGGSGASYYSSGGKYSPCCNLYSATATICNGNSIFLQGALQTTAGTYYDTFVSANGCDSLIATSLTVNPAITSSQTLILCAGESITVGTNTYTATSIYTDTLAAINGCDSTVTTDLTVENAINVSTTVNAETITADATGAMYQWIDCNNSFTIISGETSQSYIATSNGNYAVVITQGSCSDTSVCVQITTVGIASLQKEGIAIYPNPVSNELIIEINGNKNTKFEILNSLGQIVFKGNLTEKTVVPTEHFLQGVYLIKLENGKTFEFKKIVKE